MVGLKKPLRSNGDSGRTRTPNLLIRSQLLYPVELRNLLKDALGCAGFYQLCPDGICRRVFTPEIPFSVCPSTISGKGEIIGVGLWLYTA